MTMTGKTVMVIFDLQCQRMAIIFFIERNIGKSKPPEKFACSFVRIVKHQDACKKRSA